MTQCPNCGFAIEAAWKFCPKCRSNLATNEAGQFCPACGATVRPSDRFCSSCRQQLRPAADTPAPSQAAPLQAAPTSAPSVAGASALASASLATQVAPPSGESIGELALQQTLHRMKQSMREMEVGLQQKELSGYVDLYNKMKLDKVQRQIHEEEERLRLERERIEVMSRASTEVLISISGDEQSRLLAEVAQVHALKGLSKEQILAKGAADNPEFAASYKELLMAVSANGDLDNYERLINELRESSDASREDYQRNIQTMSEMFHKAVDSLKDVSVAHAGHRSASGAGAI